VAPDAHWSDATDLQSVLDLELLDRDLFRGRNAVIGRGRQSLYGGQVAAQALRAAGLTMPEGRHPHSLHGYFLRPGRADRPVWLHVDRDRDGRSFSARHVRAVQDGDVIFSMLASFQDEEPSGTYDAVPTAVPPAPQDIDDVRGDRVVEMREITKMRIDGDRITYPDALWVRVKDPLPDDRLLRACALTYVSDLGSGFGQLNVPGLSSGGTSIDHAVWFHEDIRVDDWLLLELHPVKARGARGVYTGGLRDRAGVLGLLCAQEVMLRPHPPEHLATIRAMLGEQRRSAPT
jgi:acyl-CoA thioesterase-2